jgi:hypothetical protein
LHHLVFFVLGLADERAEAARDRLAADERIASVRLMTSEDALAQLRSTSPELVDALTQNPLPSKIDLVPRRASDAPALTSELNQNAERKPLETSVGEQEFEWYVSRKLSLNQIDLIESESWGTFRTYSVPAGTSPRAVRNYFHERLSPEWTLVSDHPNGANDVYMPIYVTDGRCVWFHIGVAAGPLPKGRFFTVATHAVRGSECF